MPTTALGTETLAVTGSHVDRFELIGNELFLKIGTPIDFESLAQLSLTVEIDDPTLGDSSDGNVAFTLTITDLNEPPSLSLANVITSLPENSDTSTRRKLADIIVADDALGTETLAVTGAHVDRFELIGNELFLKTGTPTDFESLAQLSVTVEIDDPMIGASPEHNAVYTLSITDLNEPPNLSLANVTTSLPENTETGSRRKLADIIVTDDALGTETLAITGSHIDRFELIGNELFLKTGTPIDFESLAQLSVTVEIDDPTLGEAPESNVAFTLTITDVNEPPSLSLANATTSLLENADTSVSRKLADVVITDDALGIETLTLTGAHVDRFELRGSGLFLKSGTPIDFESLAQLLVSVQIDDPTLGASPEGTAAFTLTITDVNEPPSLSLANVTTSLPENADTSVRRKLADIIVTDDALGIETLTLTGAHVERFELTGSELFLKIGTPLDFESLAQLLVSVQIDDPTLGESPVSTVAFTLAITDVNEPPSLSLANAITNLPENTDTSVRLKLADIIISDDALGIESLTLSGSDVNFFELTGNELFLKAETVLDFELQSQLSVVVQIDDVSVAISPDGSREFVLTITDVSEQPSDEDNDGVRDAVEDVGPNAGDGNHDGIPDSSQSNVTSVPYELDGTYITVAAPSGVTLSQVQVEDSASQVAPELIDFPLGRLRFSVPTSEPRTPIMVTLYLEDHLAEVNGYYKFGPTPGNPAPHWYPFLYNGTTGAKILSDRIELYLIDNGRGDGDLTNNVILDPGGPIIDSRLHPWQHPLWSLDVNDDSFVSPVDALQIINELNSNGPRELSATLVASNLPPNYLDVSGDGFISPVDALQVINDLNENGPRALDVPSGEPEGESSRLPADAYRADVSRDDLNREALDRLRFGSRVSALDRQVNPDASTRYRRPYEMLELSPKRVKNISPERVTARDTSEQDLESILQLLAEDSASASLWRRND